MANLKKTKQGKKPKKLRLSKETLKDLTARGSEPVKGGRMPAVPPKGGHDAATLYPL